MKMNKSLILSFIAASLLAVGCDKESEGIPAGNGNAEKEVSQVALAAFSNRYPGAQNVTWSVKNGYAVADFSLAATRADAKSHSAWFQNRNGEWKMTEEDILFEDLPEPVKIGFSNSKYAKDPWVRTGDVDKLERKDVVMLDGSNGVIVVYVIEVEKNTNGVETEMDLYFSTEGILVNEVADAPDDNYEGYIPSTPTTSITQYLQTNYLSKGGRLIDVDREDGGTEVELIFQNRKLELFFDASEAWIYTKTDYHLSDITSGAVPADILSALRTSPYYTSDTAIDDIEKVEHKDKLWWHFELEYRWDDVDVYVDETGILPERPTIDMGNTGSNGTPVQTDIQNFINEKYNGASIIEQEWEKGYLEVEILHNTIKKEVTFNGRNEWVKTEWEVLANQLPAAVTNAITEDYRLDDDEADYVETPTSKYYKIDVVKILNGQEYKLYIEENGTIIRTIYDD